MMKRKIKVGLMFGGRSGEHEVSLMSATSVLAALDLDKYEPVPIGITKEGRWITTNDPLATLKRNEPVEGCELPVKLLQELDVVFPILHGPYGEDGTIQGLLEILDVPYVGAGVTGSAVGMDKRIMKQVFRQYGLPVVKFITFSRREWQEEASKILARVACELGYPCFVKPVNLGSSVGISKANNAAQLDDAIALASQYDSQVIVEEFINCREIEISVLGNERPQVSIPGEIVPHLEFYNYEAKYTAGKSDLIIPAPLCKEKTKEIQDLALQAFIAAGVCGMARVDFFIDKNTETVFINELNTIPGFTQLSMYPKLWEASGISYPDLIEKLIFYALERYNEKKSKRIV
ncbi:MAG: D-alanine--D-alanine ligase family protein [bacterium]|jgi:D-alanine-D-alanine ligase